MHHSSCLEELDGPNCGDVVPQKSIRAHLIPNYSLQLFDIGNRWEVCPA